jgi:hypothetical protein
MTGGKDERSEAEQLISDVRKKRAQRELEYREQALRIYPPVCARCGREFAGRRLRELTVHHKDHNHENNPADGSNWELLCIYCHDEEHQKFLDPRKQDAGTDRGAGQTHRPFAGLADLLKKKNEHS